MIDGTFIRHEACPKCGSSDNVGVWEDAYGNESKFCFTSGCDFSEGIGKTITSLSMPKLTYTDLSNRGINKQTCIKYGVGVDEDKTELWQPYYKEGKIVAAKVREHPKDFRWEGKNTELILFGSHLFKKFGKQLIITEGELDALAAYQMTRIPSVSIPNGAKNAKKAIQKNLEYVESFKTVYICFDNDEDGQAATDDVMELLRAGIAHRVMLERKDACEYLMNGDLQSFRQSLGKAQPRRIDAYYTQDKLHEKWLQFFCGGEDKGVPTGIEKLDKLISLRKGELTTIYANPSVGKSTLVRQIAANWVNMGKKVLLCPFEERDIKYWAMVVGMVKHIKLLATPLSIEEREQMFNEVKDKLFLSTITNSTQARDIKTMLEYSVRSEDIDLIIFDNITKFTACSQNQTQEIQSVLSTLVTVAQACHCHVICVSHTSRNKDLEEGEAPTMFSAFNSGAIERFSDIVITMGRKLDTNVCTVAVRKDRSDNRVGEFTLIYDSTSATFKGGATVGKEKMSHTREVTNDAQSEKERNSVRLEAGSTSDGEIQTVQENPLTSETVDIQCDGGDGLQPRRDVQGETSHTVLGSEGSPIRQQSKGTDAHSCGRKTIPEVCLTKSFPTLQVESKVKYLSVAR